VIGLDFVEAVHEKAKEIYSESYVHGLPHAEEVRKNAVKLQEMVGGDRDVIEIAALLHDCGYSKGREKHGEKSAQWAEQILKLLDYPKTQQVVEAIRNHPLNVRNEGASLEAKIVYDADKMEVLKPWGILRVAGDRPHASPEELLRKIRFFCVEVYDRLYLDETKQLIKEDYAEVKRIVEELDKQG
jgi:HD superfamily phosphodiesterase